MGQLVAAAEVRVDDTLDVRLVPGPPLPEGATLLLRHRAAGHERRVPLPGPEFSIDLNAVDVVPGFWDVYLETPGAAEPYRLVSLDPGFTLDGLDAYAAERRTVSRLAYRSMTGHLSIKVREVRPAVDVRAVWLREGRFEVTGLLTFTGLPDDGVRRSARLALSRPDQEQALAVDATVEGVSCHAAVSLCDIVALPAGTWTLWLTAEGMDEPMRLGGRLDDVTAKRRPGRYPVSRVDGVTVRPRYDENDDLVIEVAG